jgi:gentisate 1,2-dioxygenase
VFTISLPEAAAFPERPPRIVSGFAAGGGSDTLSRLVAEAISALLGQRVAVENRTGVNGAAVHLLGRGDFVSMFLHEIPPNKATSPQRHLYEEVVFVLEGRGSTTIEFEDGRKHSFEWRPCSVFAIPLNAKYRYFNGSGTDRALLVTTTSLPIMMNLLRNEDFIFFFIVP